MNPFKAIGKGLKRAGTVVAYPVTKPVSMLARKAGEEAAGGAVDKIKQEVADVVQPRDPIIGDGRPTGWQALVKYLIESIVVAIGNKLRRR